MRGPESGKPEIVSAGVRIFEAGVEGDIETGQDSSRAAVRRMARQMRRQACRRVQRKRKLFSLLQNAGLLPRTSDTLPMTRDAVIKKLDATLLSSLPTTYGSCGHVATKLPYVLRAEALKRSLTPEELGRVLYHLGERRGFKSNRRTDRQSEDTGKVYDGIAAIRAKKGERTFGEYFAELDPKQERIRGQYLHRDDYEDEFSRIFDAQQPSHAALTPKFRRRLKRCLFWQRPLRSQKAKIGRCSLLTNRRRCPMAHPIAQEFRLLQGVNHLAIIFSDGATRLLEPEERNTLLDALRTEGDITFAKARKQLRLPKTTRFNLEEGREKKLVGNRTHKAMFDAIGDEWEKLSEGNKATLVGIVRGSADAAALRGQVSKLFPSLSSYCDALDKVSLEDKLASHCKKVLADLVSRMQDGGIPYSTARADFEATHNLGAPTTLVDQLPPVREFLSGITNPAVIRALTELRKVMNEIVRLYGKPGMIRIELARDLKKPRDLRKKISEKMRNREAERSRATQMLTSNGNTNPSRADVEKVLLADECGWVCPYTGQTFRLNDLVGEHPTMDVEHIYPRRYLDDSFANKTLCVARENRAGKMDRLPFEAYSGDSVRYREILARVGAFKGNLRDEKIRRFLTNAVEADFASRQLADTAYTSREAARYVGLLYGGIVDVRSDKRVRTSSGRLTALLRSAWKLNSILGTDQSPKGRGVDHRHHAVDAVVIALTTDSIIKHVTDSAQKYATRSSGRWRIDIPDQDGLLEQSREEIKRIVVSHRVDRRIAGRLHEDSIYSPPRSDGNGGTYHVIRKPLVRLSPADITGDKIVDPRVRKIIQEQYAKLCRELLKTKPLDVFASEANLPHLSNRNGPPIPVRKVRIRVRDKAERIGDEPHRARHIMKDSDGLHHTVIFSKREGTKERWNDEPATRLQVHDRHRKEEKIIQMVDGPDTEYQFHLCKGDLFRMDEEVGDASQEIYVVRGVAGKDITIWKAWDATAKTKENRIRTANTLRDRHAVPVVVSPTGRVFDRGDRNQCT